MATKGTGKMDQPAITALMVNKTIAIAGDGTESENFRNLRGDASTQTLITTEFEHAEIHLGDHYYFSDANTVNAGTSDAIDYMLIVPNTNSWPHITFDVDGSAITSFSLYEDCVQATSDGWTQETVYNNNRNSSNHAGMEIWSKIGSSDASSDYGNLIWQYSSGTATERSNNPAGTRASREFILGKNIKYIFRILSGSASNLCNFLFSWYEHTNES